MIRTIYFSPYLHPSTSRIVSVGYISFSYWISFPCFWGMASLAPRYYPALMFPIPLGNLLLGCIWYSLDLCDNSSALLFSQSRWLALWSWNYSSSSIGNRWKDFLNLPSSLLPLFAYKYYTVDFNGPLICKDQWLLLNCSVGYSISLF